MDQQADNGVKLLFSTEETIMDWAVDYYDDGTATVRNEYSEDGSDTHLTWKVVDGKVIEDGDVLAGDATQRAYKSYLEIALAQLIVGQEDL